jgi:hypothetical protein
VSFCSSSGSQFQTFPCFIFSFLGFISSFVLLLSSVLFLTFAKNFSFLVVHDRFQTIYLKTIREKSFWLAGLWLNLFQAASW